MGDSFDVVVVGARCAGAPLAALLARAGVRVCLVDKNEFPSDTPSTHAIQPVGVQVLERLGVLDELLRIAPPIVSGRIIFDEGEAVVEDIPAISGAPLVCVRRTALDDVLVRAAAAAGVDVRTGTPVTGLVHDGGRVAGVVTRTGEVRARLVVGADGAHSTVAKLAGAEEYCQTPNGRIFMWGYYDGDPTDGEVWIAKVADRNYLVLPTDGGLTLVAGCPSIDRRAEVRADRERVFEEGLRTWPRLAAALEGSQREGGVRTMANLRGFFRRSTGPGWALTGDAGHFKDPAPGQGIADALRQAERLCAAIVAGLGHGDLDAELQAWWRWRDEDAWEMYWFAYDVGAGGATPPLLGQVQRRTVSEPAVVDKTMRVFNHELRPSQAFGPWFAVTTLAQALRRPGERRETLRDAASLAREEFRRRAMRRRLPTAG